MASLPGRKVRERYSILERSVQDYDPASHSQTLKASLEFLENCLRKMWTSVLNVGKDLWGAGRDAGSKHLCWGAD